MNNAEKPSRGLAHAAAFTVALVMIVLKGLLFRPVWPLFVFCFCFFFVFLFFFGEEGTLTVLLAVSLLCTYAFASSQKKPQRSTGVNRSSFFF